MAHLQQLVFDILVEFGTDRDVQSDYFDDNISESTVMLLLAHLLCQKGLEVATHSIRVCNCPLKAYDENLSADNLVYCCSSYLWAEGKCFTMEFGLDGLVPMAFDSLALAQAHQEKRWASAHRNRSSQWFSEIKEADAPSVNQSLARSLGSSRAMRILTDCMERHYAAFRQSHLKETLPQADFENNPGVGKYRL